MKLFRFLMCSLGVFVFSQAAFTAAAPNHEDKKLYATDPRIINGSNAELNNTMHQVSIRRRLSDSYFFGTGHICGGSLISHTVVLSAAHCFVDFGSPNHNYITAHDFIVVMGNLDRFERNNTLTFDITHIVFRTPHFNTSSYYRDIAVVFLNGTVPTNHPTIRPIALNTKHVAPGTICQITGWGRTEQGFLSDVLKTLDVPIISNVVCDQETYFEPGYILDGMMCAGYLEGERDACDGDSGGPMVCNGTLAGITSWGDGCAQPMLPGVYTDIAFYGPWIRSVVHAAGGKLDGEGGATSTYRGSIVMVISLTVIITWLSGNS